MKKNLFGDICREKKYRVNIYGDEICSKKCPYTGDEWMYIGIIIENTDFPLLPDIITERYLGNRDKKNPYFNKNKKVIV